MNSPTSVFDPPGLLVSHVSLQELCLRPPQRIHHSTQVRTMVSRPMPPQFRYKFPPLHLPGILFHNKPPCYHTIRTGWSNSRTSSQYNAAIPQAPSIDAAFAAVVVIVVVPEAGVVVEVVLEVDAEVVAETGETVAAPDALRSQLAAGSPRH